MGLAMSGSASPESPGRYSSRLAEHAAGGVDSVDRPAAAPASSGGPRNARSPVCGQQAADREHAVALALHVGAASPIAGAAAAPPSSAVVCRVVLARLGVVVVAARGGDERDTEEEGEEPQPTAVLSHCVTPCPPMERAGDGAPASAQVYHSLARTELAICRPVALTIGHDDHRTAVSARCVRTRVRHRAERGRQRR